MIPHVPRPHAASPALLLFLTQLTCTLFMTGLIWFVQVVHYPLFHAVGDAALPRYEHLHAQRTMGVVFPPMLLELLTALVALLPRLRLPSISRSEAIASAVLVLGIWLSTALLQIPLHNLLDRAPTPAVIDRLILSNWIRTIAWTLRSALLLTATTRLLLAGPWRTSP